MLTFESISARIAEYEQEIVKIVNTHATLIGGLNELKQLLTLAGDVVGVLAPEAAPAIEAVNAVVGEVTDAITPAASEEAPASDVIDAVHAE